MILILTRTPEMTSIFLDPTAESSQQKARIPTPSQPTLTRRREIWPIMTKTKPTPPEQFILFPWRRFTLDDSSSLNLDKSETSNPVRDLGVVRSKQCFESSFNFCGFYDFSVHNEESRHLRKGH
jgi:hypothetical protein